MRTAFISYCRDDGEEKAKEVDKILSEQGIRTYLDIQDLSKGRWRKEIRKLIKESDIFISIITPRYVERLKDRKTIISEEFSIALKKSKDNIIPLICLLTPKELENVFIKCRIKLSDFQFALDNAALVRMVFDKCFDAELAYIQEKSYERMQADRNRTNSILNMTDDEIYRDIILNGKKYNCNIRDIYRMLDKSRYICITGDGGCGKTFVMQKLFEELYKNTDEKYIKIYVPLGSVDYNKGGLLNYEGIGRAIQRLYTHPNNKEVVFLLDGLNEMPLTEKNSIEAIMDLVGNHSKVKVILSTRYLPRDLSNLFAHATISEINSDDIKKYLKVDTFNVPEGSILRLPLYLRLYKLKYKDDKKIVPQHLLKSQLMKMIFIESPKDIFKLTEEVEVAYKYLIPYICFRMTNENTLRLTRTKLIKYVNSCKNFIPKDEYKKSLFCAIFNEENIEEKLSRVTCDSVVEQLFPISNSLDDSSEKEYNICHQDIRDFFAAYYIDRIVRLTKERELKNEKIIEDFVCVFSEREKESKNGKEQKAYDSDAIPMLEQTIKNTLKTLTKYTYEDVSDNLSLCVCLLKLVHFIVNKTLENAHNASEEKEKVCKQYQETIYIAREFILDSELYKKSLDCALADILLLDVEINRRLKLYNDSIDTSTRLKEVAVAISRRDMELKAINNIAKCTLYLASDVAKKCEGVYSKEAENLYRDAISALESNTELAFSANLYSMLLANPDVVSAPYIERIVGDDINSRRLIAFQREYEAFLCGSNIYALNILISYILHGYVCLTGIEERDGKLHPVFEKNTADGVCDIRQNREHVLRILHYYIETYFSKSNSPVILCFKGLLMLQEANRHSEAATFFKKSFSLDLNGKRVKGSLLGCFLFAVLSSSLSKEERDSLLNCVWLALEEGKCIHMPDNFDNIYVLFDVVVAWNGIQEKCISLLDKKQTKRVNDTLEAIQTKYEEEKKKWEIQ